MIGKLKGIVDSHSPDYAIIDVGGVGYLVYCAKNTLETLEQSKSCELYITTHVREDHIHLYGFLTSLEKEYFALLQTVSGIGTRMALSVLSNLSPDQINIAVSQKNKDAFKGVSGVGAKLAERIVIELKDKVKNNINATSDSAIFIKSIDYGKVQDGISALVYLGVHKQQAQNIIHSILSQNPDIKTDELIRLALKERKT